MPTVVVHLVNRGTIPQLRYYATGAEMVAMHSLFDAWKVARAEVFEGDPKTLPQRKEFFAELEERRFYAFGHVSEFEPRPSSAGLAIENPLANLLAQVPELDSANPKLGVQPSTIAVELPWARTLAMTEILASPGDPSRST